jgi:hypothetical protein
MSPSVAHLSLGFCLDVLRDSAGSVVRGAVLWCVPHAPTIGMLCIPPLYAVSFGRTERLRPVQNGSALNSQHELVDDSLFVPACVLVVMGWLHVLRESPFATAPSPSPCACDQCGFKLKVGR